MIIKFEQVFYGRGERGYGILGASPGADKFIARTEALCGAVGTPAVDYGGEPFLLSVPEEDRIVMACGRRGALDAMGRATLFFHVLIAAKTDLYSAEADAFSLFTAGAFAERMPDGKTECLRIDTQAEPNEPAPGMAVLLPAVFRSPAPAANLVQRAVAGRANGLSWATYAFQPLPGFDVQVLPPRVLCMQASNEYDATGKIVHSAEVANAPHEVEKPDHGSEKGKQTRCSNVVFDGSLSKKSNAVPRLSIAANLVLAAACAVLLVSRKSMPDSPASKTEQVVVTNFVERVVEKPVAAPLSDEQKSAIEEAAVAQFRSDLNNNFPRESRVAFLGYKDEINSCNFKRYYGYDYDTAEDQEKANDKKEHDLLVKLAIGIDFVNKNLLKGEKP